MMKCNVKGYLTVYVSLCMCVMISLCLVLIEGARRSSIRLEGEIIMDIGMESILAEYHRELLRQYNLFYVDSSYGGENPSYSNVERRLTYYLDKNTVYQDELMLDFMYRDFLGMEFNDVRIKTVRLATDDCGYGIARQAVEAVKDDIGVSYLEGVWDWIQKVEVSGLLDGDTEKQKKELEEKLQPYEDKEISLSETEWTTFDVVSPTKIVDNMQAKGILWWVIPKEQGVSAQTVDISQYVSGRRAITGLNRGNGDNQEKLELMERLLFHEYLLRYTGRYGAEKEEGLLAYQTEYLVEGETSDEKNLSGVAGKICLMRQVANTSYLMANPEKLELVKGVATLIAAALLLPEAAPVLEGAIVLAWAYLESVYDTKVLMSGGSVPMLKSDQSWHYGLESIWQEPGNEAAKGQGEGQNYEDYLRILLFGQRQEDVISRFMDVVEMDIRLTKENAKFRLDGCLDYVGMSAVIQSAYGYDFEIARERGY